MADMTTTYPSFDALLDAARDRCLSTTVNSAVLNAATELYKMRHGRYNSRGIDNMVPQVEASFLQLVNDELATPSDMPTLADTILYGRSHLIVAWAVAQKLKEAP
jgi:hypothetical protein